MFRNVTALAGVVALGAMLAGCGEAPNPETPKEGAPAVSVAPAGSLASVNRVFARLDQDADNKVSRAEFIARAEARFKKLDKNGDGVVVAAELPKTAKPAVFFKRDKDGNNKVTLAEFKAPDEDRFAKLDANKDGFVAVEEAPAPKTEPATTTASE